MIKAVISLDYNSKNKRFGRDNSEAVAITDTPEVSAAYIRSPEDAVTVAEQIILTTQWNLEFTETLSSSDALNGWSLNKKVSDSIPVSDIKEIWHDGMLNTSMINTRLIGVGSTEASENDVNIT